MQNKKQRPLLVAEISANHNQNLELAKKHILYAKKAGANAVKIQTYTPSCLTLNSKSNIFKINANSPWDGKYLFELYSEAFLPWEWHEELFEYAKNIDIEIFSSPFSLRALELLESLHCPRYKIASFECVDLDFIYEVAKTKKPIILSTGVAQEEEIKDAVLVCKKAGNNDITLLQCTSAYPAPLKKANLSKMPLFFEKYGVKYGLSDHTLGNLCAIIATTLGASLIEKHFILDKKLGGVDSDFSMDFKEFCGLSKEIDNVILALGDKDSPRVVSEQERVFARSLFVKKKIQKGEILTRENIGSFRPNAGLHPKYLKDVLGRIATKDLEFSKPLNENDFE
ncbi:pseudaminic acid synthase [Helicobacter anatolicus]|uniref:pseudaminic acid synthase n=1 Tax=Helicobacter anatolicus TaxID=2905874 RepID=UPI001E5640E5|nr:pseudaminic acid synthase [Helicobacter anatolicus]MCE3038133.1 pseudaminic acid synthase [Helicobacter anatolicus]